MTTFTLSRFDRTELNQLDAAAGFPSGFGTLRTVAGNLPLKQLGYQTQIVGLTVQTTITQTYYNPFDQRSDSVTKSALLRLRTLKSSPPQFQHRRCDWPRVTQQRFIRAARFPSLVASATIKPRFLPLTIVVSNPTLIRIA